eukprot:bmy_10271T0
MTLYGIMLGYEREKEKTKSLLLRKIIHMGS